MKRAFLALVLALCCALIAAPSKAGYGGYGYGGYGGHGYGGYNYYPSYGYGYNNYGYATIPTHGYGYNYYPTYSYGYSYPSYTPTYAAPSYSAAVNYYDGAYHYHDAGTFQGVWYPAGYYAWRDGKWVTSGQNTASAVPKDWKNHLLDLAAARDQIEGQVRLNNAEYNAFASAVKGLGLEGNFRMDGYGQPPSPAPGQGGYTPPPGVGYGQGGYANHNANLGTYGANGSTLYSYSLASVKDVYGDTNMNTLFQQAAQLAQNAQALGGEATTQFQTTISREGTNRARVAEILAKAQAASEALRAAEGSGARTETHSTITRVDPAGPPPNPTPQGPPQGPPPGVEQPGAGGRAQGQAQADPAFVQLATAKCLRCHGPDKQEGKFDVRRYSAMPLKEKAERVWPLLTTPDKERRMPRGGALTPEELQLFFRN